MYSRLVFYKNLVVLESGSLSTIASTFNCLNTSESALSSERVCDTIIIAVILFIIRTMHVHVGLNEILKLVKFMES